jgi:hypothetical protein
MARGVQPDGSRGERKVGDHFLGQISIELQQIKSLAKLNISIVQAHTRLPILMILPILLLSACTFTPVTPINTALSPDRIAEDIQTNGFTALEKTRQALDIVPSEYFFEQGDKLTFSVRRFYFESQNDEEYALLIIVEDDFKWDWQYLIFRKNGADWKFLGNLDLGTQKYTEPSYRVVIGDKDEVWLVVRSLTGSGTGFTLYEEVWYKLNGKKIEITLRYPVKGHVAPLIPPANVDFEGEVTAHWQDGDIHTIALMFSALYWDYEIERGEYQLFSTKRKAFYNWSPVQNRFLLDTEKSEVSQEQIDNEFYYNNSKDFFKYTYDELSELAKNGNVIQKEWLNQLLDGVEDNPNKEALLKILETNGK